MTLKEAKELYGLYILEWDEGGYSMAAVGRDEDGTPWFAPANWIRVPSYDWEVIKRAQPVMTAIKVGEI